MLLPGLVALALMPLVVYKLIRPEIKSTPNAAQFARERLREMGPITRGELIMLGVFGVLLVLWAGLPTFVFGPGAAVDPTTTAFIGLSLCLITGVLTWDDVIKARRLGHHRLVRRAGDDGQHLPEQAGLIAWFTDMQTGISTWAWGGWAPARAADADLPVRPLRLCQHHGAHHHMFAAFTGAGLALGAPAYRSG